MVAGRFYFRLGDRTVLHTEGVKMNHLHTTAVVFEAALTIGRMIQWLI
ncbi:hypothetical protein Mal52_27880 [Symmachiella dynata]|uniref:Uncharacterized protein n=1 Tax=Symmachiella dynata TaxID=2527995 RepID=A0A517ZPA4_9PLAN|nr:hypothetical protein Mal52_27880 [Symmachiella dynata]